MRRRRAPAAATPAVRLQADAVRFTQPPQMGSAVRLFPCALIE